MTARKHSPVEAADWRQNKKRRQWSACGVRIIVVAGPRNSMERCPAVVRRRDKKPECEANQSKNKEKKFIPCSLIHIKLIPTKVIKANAKVTIK